ncbi:MAG: response regulator transcription factor, partial [Solirubrobacteraceae bacterium]
AQLGPVAADRERHAGSTMPLAHAITLATEAATRPSRVALARPALTNREREVADLVAAGDTNRQLARTLGISEKTVEVHLRNIMAKLETPGRAGVAAWAVSARQRPS